MNHMDIKGIKTQAELYCLFKKIVAEKPRIDEITYSKVELEYRVKQSRRRADLVLFFQEQNREEKPFLVIETKRSKRDADQTNYDQVVLLPELGKLTVREALAKGIWDEDSYKYHSGALQQAKEYAEGIGAPFFAVCYANSFFIRSFVERHGLYYPSVDFTEEFGLKLLKDLAQLYKNQG
jgi:hypothetical protein